MMKQKYVYRNHEGEREMMNGLLVVIEVFSVICQRIYTQKILTRRNDNRIMEYCTWIVSFMIINYLTWTVSKNAWEQYYHIYHFILFDAAHFIL